MSYDDYFYGNYERYDDSDDYCDANNDEENGVAEWYADRGMCLPKNRPLQYYTPPKFVDDINTLDINTLDINTLDINSPDSPEYPPFKQLASKAPYIPAIILSAATAPDSSNPESKSPTLISPASKSPPINIPAAKLQSFKRQCEKVYWAPKVYEECPETDASLICRLTKELDHANNELERAKHTISLQIMTIAALKTKLKYDT